MWRRVAPELWSQGALTPLTRDLVARFCEVSAVLEQAYELIGRGLLAPGRRERLVTNPAWRIYRDAVELQLALARGLGILPITSRSATSRARPTG